MLSSSQPTISGNVPIPFTLKKNSIRLSIFCGVRVYQEVESIEDFQYNTGAMFYHSKVLFRIRWRTCSMLASVVDVAGCLIVSRPPCLFTCLGTVQSTGNYFAVVKYCSCIVLKVFHRFHLQLHLHTTKNKLWSTVLLWYKWKVTQPYLLHDSAECNDVITLKPVIIKESITI